MHLIGYSDRHIDRCIGQYIGQYIDCRPRVDRCFRGDSTDVGRGIDRDRIGSLSVNYGGISVNSRRNVGRVSFDSRARVYR